MTGIARLAPVALGAGRASGRESSRRCSACPVATELAGFTGAVTANRWTRVSIELVDHDAVEMRPSVMARGYVAAFTAI